MLGNKYDFIIKSSNMPKHCAAYECSENYAGNQIIPQSVFQKTNTSGIDGMIQCQMTEKLCLIENN